MLGLLRPPRLAFGPWCSPPPGARRSLVLSGAVKQDAGHAEGLDTAADGEKDALERSSGSTTAPTDGQPCDGVDRRSAGGPS